jgi:hypothetical protein
VRCQGQFNPKFPFTYQFLDEAYNSLYISEQMINKLSGYFAIIAIFICCLGLLGLVMFTAEQRIKEIGIRKVLGANTASVFGLLSKGFFSARIHRLYYCLTAGVVVREQLVNWFCLSYNY